MKIIKEETSFMRDNVPALDVETTAVVDPTYKKAVDDRERIKKHLEDTLKDKEVRKDPILGTKEDKLNLEESLFEDYVKPERLKEAMIEVDDDDILSLLEKELDGWNPSPEIKDLYMKMYESQVAEGLFNGGKFNAMEIVDNDWVNWTDVISEGEDYFDDCLKAYKERNYEVRVSDDYGDDRYLGYIEAVDNESDPKTFLIRVN